MGIRTPIEDIEFIPKETYKKLIKKKILEKSLEYLIDKRKTRNGKGMALSYDKLQGVPKKVSLFQSV